MQKKKKKKLNYQIILLTFSKTAQKGCLLSRFAVPNFSKLFILNYPRKSMRKNNPIIYFYPFLAEVLFYFLASISQTSQKRCSFFFSWLKYPGIMGTNDDYFISTGPELDMLGNKEPNSSSWVPELMIKDWEETNFLPSAAEMLKSKIPSFQHTFPKSYLELNSKTSSEKSLKLYFKSHSFCSFK